MLRTTPEGYEAIVTDPAATERFAASDAIHLILVEGGSGPISAPGSLPVVVCWIGDRFGGDGPAQADLVTSADRVGELVAAVDGNPLAAVSFALLLRASEGVGVEHALTLESATYSMLQDGPEFRRWRAGVEPVDQLDDRPVVARRSGAELRIVLNRPHRHNAITTRLRDQLHETLALAVMDDSIERIVLAGAGPSFCSGGDLAEFGWRPDTTTAHITRLARSPARLLHRLRPRVTAQVHGSVLGGGIEMAAFADRIVADSAATFALPEISIGLIPGAGGTVSLPRRIGRQRTAALGLTGRPIDSPTALEWGLIDRIGPVQGMDPD